MIKLLFDDEVLKCRLMIKTSVFCFGFCSAILNETLIIATVWLIKVCTASYKAANHVMKRRHQH